VDLSTWLVVANGCAWALMALYVGGIVARPHAPSRTESVAVLAAFWLVTWGGLARRLKAAEADLVIGVAWTAVSVALAYGLARALTRRNQPPPAI
jgi:hypothetical protein